MEGNESVDIGQDTREKLEEDVRSHFWHHDCCRTDMVLGWLDRQAAITERYWMHLCGCTTNASVEISKKLKAAEDENVRLREELEAAGDEIDRLKKDRDGWQQLCTDQIVTYMEHIEAAEDENVRLRDLVLEQNRLVGAVHAYWSGGKTFEQFSDVFKAIARVTILAGELGIEVPE